MNKPGLDTSMGEICETVSQACSQCSSECAERIRRAPLASVLGAAALGYFLQFLPVAAILNGLVRVVLGLVKPALIVFGVVKLVSCLKGCCREKVDAEREPLLDSPAGPPVA